LWGYSKTRPQRAIVFEKKFERSHKVYQSSLAGSGQFYSSASQ
jgi:hypothetical protein